jgi:hypothetical protein
MCVVFAPIFSVPFGVVVPVQDPTMPQKGSVAAVSAVL